MVDVHSNDKITNSNHSFTELLHLLTKRKYNNPDIGLDYNMADMSKILVHTDNAIKSILHGLQSMGTLMAVSSCLDKNEINHIGYFVTLLGNLMEAFCVVRADFEYALVGDCSEMESNQTLNANYYPS